MTDDDVLYIDYVQAVDLHFALMKAWGESRFGVDNRDLIESALARPKHARNKRTASFLMYEFLLINQIDLTATSSDLYEMSLAVESNTWVADDIENWLREKTKEITK